MCENGYKTGFTHYTIIENLKISEFLKNFEYLGQVDRTSSENIENSRKNEEGSNLHRCSLKDIEHD